MNRRLSDRIPTAKPLFKQRLAQIWCAVFIGATAFVLVVNYYVMVSLREEVVNREQAQLRQVVNATGGAVGNLFKDAREILESIRDHTRPSIPPMVTHEMLQTVAGAAPYIRAIGIISVKGVYLYSSRDFPAPDMDLKDAPVVTYFRDNRAASDSYYITAPERSPVSGRWQVILGIPRRGADGVPTEILSAVIDIRAIQAEMMAAGQGDGRELKLLDSSFSLIASNPPRESLTGMSIAGTPAYGALLQPVSRQSTGIVTDPDTGAQSVTALRWLGDGRMAITGTRPMDIVLEDWRLMSTTVLAFSILILALIASAAFLSVRDSLRRDRQRDALLLSQQRFRLLVDGVTDHAIYMLDADGKVSNWNHSAERIMGYNAQEVTGRSFEMFFTMADRASGEPARILAAARTGVYRSESLRERKDGTSFCAHVVMSAVFDGAGKHIGFSEIARDITESNAFRQELKLAKETAEAALAVKSDFLANMSHEIRTPLNGIIGYADLALEDRSLLPVTRHQIARVFEASKSLHVIIDDILDLSKIEARGVDLRPMPFHLGHLVDTCTSIIRPRAAKSDLAVFSHVETGVPEGLLGDAPRLRQVLINLLNNAVKFTEHGSVTLAVKCLSRSDSAVRIQFNVTDTGIGISAEDQVNLFQRFNQADSSISRKFGGTGLGLAISKLIVKAMRGELMVCSAPGEGSTFSFTIDLPMAEPVQLESNAEPAVKAATPQRILSVDDVEMNRELCKAILTRAGHTVTLADSGAAAMRLILKKDFDLILMDVQMPGMDGIEVTRRIRRLRGSRGKVPIIALTANVMADQISYYKSAGMDGHIGKPLVKAELLASVMAFGSRTAAPAAEAAAPSAAIHDQTALEELKGFVSPDLLNAMVAGLRRAIAAVPAPGHVAPGGHEALSEAAHKAITLAGQLGFVELAEAFRSLEAACLRGQPVAEALTELQSAAERARDGIETIAAA